MKKKLILIFIIFVSIACTPCYAKADSEKVKKGRTKATKAELSLKLGNVPDSLGFETLSKTQWSLGIQFNEPDNIKSTTEVIEDIEAWVSEGKEISFRSKGEAKQLRKYANNIKKLIKNINYEDGQSAIYLYSKNQLPILFAEKDGKIVFFVTKYGSKKIFNTLKVSEKKRASKIISSIILPCMKEFESAFKDTAIRYYGMVVIYGSEDFSKNNDVLSSQGEMKAEMVSMVVSAEQCKKFVNAEITDADLIATADIYSSDRTQTFDIKKIKVVLD